ncbi:MAG TPA: hypothetical protein VFB41_08945 [Solirubrobacteraceae bacterium]|nr:hypothetical protein [Solirubrobacteraceae bacterium]
MSEYELTGDAGDLEGLLSQALSPVEPPERLSERLEIRLATLTETAIEELDTLELSAMRDPRNWVRPVAAAAVVATAGAGLVVLRVRARHRKRTQKAKHPVDFAGRALHDVADEARRLLKRD